ncbi:MAG: response regulator transcription factor [Prevotella sp.]|jgi:DNA-binding NarL/FixJ family response regulator|nr:response regulator transcription factor [Prevotella sp.]MCH3992774.1 response regulator transcription factor [Prevotella sp.]MCI1472849.1 response regulator transcription factor [Prevotella sp.]MCI1518206.1 response regulator transcription factor [Prevotella sp.]MCI1548611.1 response regulator transcription factor [Prevotella sp.]MCI1595178.1 response regulator transcription factor [Prevotella sp.]
MVTYLLADNQELTRIGLEALIERVSPGNIIQVEDKSRLIELLKKDARVIILLDYTLFDFNDENSLLIVSERFPLAEWILISDDLTDTFLRRVIYSNHQFSVVFKDSPVSIICDAIVSATQRGRYICQRAMEILLDQQKKQVDTTILTSTEMEVLKAIAQGKTTKEIASERFCSIDTINTHRKNIFRKLGVNTAHEAVKYAFRAGLVDPSEFYI